MRVDELLVDRLIELYCDWRTSCGEVRDAYERFCQACAADRELAFAAYAAALDREQSACQDYAGQIRAIERRHVNPGDRARLRQAYGRA
jgi:hypothetical protein